MIGFAESFWCVDIIFGGIEVKFVDIGRIEVQEVHIIVSSLTLTAVILRIGVGLLAFFFVVYVDFVIVIKLGF